MPRPELGTLTRGQVVVVRERSRAHGPANVRDMTVVTLGPKWVGIVDAKWLDSEFRAQYVRKFLLADQREGEPGRRVGYACSFATREQHEYDLRAREAANYVRDVAGLDIRRDGPFADGDDGTLRLAHLLSLMESSWRPGPL